VHLRTLSPTKVGGGAEGSFLGRAKTSLLSSRSLQLYQVTDLVAPDLPHISSKKKERIAKKVIPHIGKAMTYYSKDSLQNSERETLIAYGNLRREGVYAPEIMHDIAALYNNLGAKYFAKRDYKKAFDLFSKSLGLKIKHESKDSPSIEGTFRNLFNPALLCCEFTYLEGTIERLMKAHSNVTDFVKYLQGCLDRTRKVKNDEPEIIIAGIHFASPILTTPIDDPVYFPESFKDVEIDLELQMTLTDHSTLNCLCTMVIPNRRQKIPIPYEKDSWKTKRPPNLEPRVADSTPNLVIFLSENGHIPTNTVTIRDEAGAYIEHNFRITFTEFFIPNSYPRFGYNFGDPPEIPHCKKFRYFRGKAAVLEWKAETGKKYRTEFCVKNYEEPHEANGLFSLRLGMLTPFAKARIRQSDLRYTEKVTLEEIKQNMIKYFEDRERPAAIAFSLEPNSLSETQFLQGSTPRGDSNQRHYYLTTQSNPGFDDYEIFGLSLRYRVSDQHVSIASFEWEQPIPTALSHLLMNASFGFPPLCRYDIINNSNRETMLSFSTEIEGFTDRQEDSKTILPRSIEHVNHTPLFKLETANIAETCTANFKTLAMLKNEILAQSTRPIRLLASDTMIWEILNPITRDRFNLHDFVVTWVTPHNKAVEKILSIAKEGHPSRSLQGYPSNLSSEDIQRSTYQQFKAIFEALKLIGISYVDSSISFGWDTSYASQRIKLPSATIETKAANCIDGTILFASLIENIGIDPIIVLVPRHALVGWRPYPNSNEILFLETTQIASADFDSAIKSGWESLNRGLQVVRNISQNATLTIEEALRMGRIRFIDVKSMRKKGVFPRIS